MTATIIPFPCHAMMESGTTAEILLRLTPGMTPAEATARAKRIDKEWQAMSQKLAENLLETSDEN